ncbi:MAG: DUF5117 domain-containing protein [Planctomycetes bacterium]|nr:DUF5117 domain-containing protein [Planctomycetota bacterium]
MSALAGCALLLPQPEAQAREFPPFDQVTKDYQRVVSTADGASSMYTVYRNSKDQQLLAELPPDFSGKRVFIATSIAGGSTFTGWQWMDMYVYWRRVGDNLVLMEPELQYQSRGEDQINSSVKRTYSDRVILSVPIITMGPGGGPVIDLDSLLVGQSGRFGMPLNPGLTTIESVKAFPQNIEITFEGPGSDGRLTKLHYSLSSIPSTNYSPREADERIGYFLTVFKDFSKDSNDGKQFVRYINRWNLKKRDPSLALSPPERPIIFYVEHTVPVKYRRYVRDGILEWNKAFEKIGIDRAIEVRQQDAKTSDYMDIDPEDVRYNFFRWITSEMAFAMGPSRVNPETGEILDADIIFDDSMARFYALDYMSLIADLPTEDPTPEEEAWLASHPNWDPRSFVEDSSHLRRYDPSAPNLTDEERSMLMSNDDVLDHTSTSIGRVVQHNRHCNYAIGMAHQMNMARLHFAGSEMAAYSDDELIDGLPEKFMAQVIKEIVTHEVGHTLGLRHNFKASTWKDLDELNEDVNEPQVGSVMDYNPLNIAPEGEEQGDWVTPVIGPYDYWAIEYGYTNDESKLAEITKRVAEAGLDFATDEDAAGPDPLVRRFDLGKDPMDYAQREVDLARKLRSELLARAVKDGEAWYPARSFFTQLLYQQAGAARIVARFVGGVHINRDRKGDPNARQPMVPVEADRQREALNWVIENSFFDESFGLDPEVLRYLATDKFNHWDNYGDSPELPIHDMVMSLQVGALWSVMNPTTLTRVYDNEMLTAADEDALTLPEVLNTVSEAVWKEVLDDSVSRRYTNRQPMISSLRRNLQRQYLSQLIDLSQLYGTYGPPRPMQALSLEWMHTLNDRMGELLDGASAERLDDYTRSHLAECRTRLQQAIESSLQYTGD